MKSNNRPVIRCPRKRFVQYNLESKKTRHTSVIPEGEAHSQEGVGVAQVVDLECTGHRINIGNGQLAPLFRALGMPDHAPPSRAHT